MEVVVNYKFYDDKSNIKNEGEARATFDDKYLTLAVSFGEPMLFAYTDIVGISDYDYKVDLLLSSKEKLNLWGLGYQYEDFLFQLYKLRNELMLKYLLMEELLLQAGFQAKYTKLDPNGQTSQTGNCEIRLYDNALVVLPQKKRTHPPSILLHNQRNQTRLQTNNYKRIPRKNGTLHARTKL